MRDSNKLCLSLSLSLSPAASPQANKVQRPKISGQDFGSRLTGDNAASPADGAQ